MTLLVLWREVSCKNILKSPQIILLWVPSVTNNTNDGSVPYLSNTCHSPETGTFKYDAVVISDSCVFAAGTRKCLL